MNSCWYIKDDTVILPSISMICTVNMKCSERKGVCFDGNFSENRQSSYSLHPALRASEVTATVHGISAGLEAFPVISRTSGIRRAHSWILDEGFAHNQPACNPMASAFARARMSGQKL